MSDFPTPLPDPSESQPRPESGPKDKDRCVVPPDDSPCTETPALEMALSATEGLCDEQRKVMAYLAAGHSIAKAARFGRVSRRTVYRWFKDDADFCAVYNAWQRELTESAKTRLLAMADDAVDTIHNAILGGNVAASLTVAKSMGLLAKPRIGPDDPQRIAQKRRVGRMRQAAADGKAIDRARSDLPSNHPLRYTPEERAQMEELDRKRREAYEKQQEHQPEWLNRFREATEGRRKNGAVPEPRPEPHPQSDPAQPAEPKDDADEPPSDSQA